MNNQQQAAFNFLDSLDVSSNFKIKTKSLKTTVTLSYTTNPIHPQNVMTALSNAMKRTENVTVLSVDYSESKVITVTFASKM